MKAEITGKIVRINDTRTSPSGYKTRTFWVEEKEQSSNGKEYANTCEFELSSGPNSKFDNTTALDNLGVGTVVNFSFSLRGNIWKGTAQKPVNPPRCFNSLRVISKINVIGNAARPAPSPATPSLPADDPMADDMPF